MLDSVLDPESASHLILPVSVILAVVFVLLPRTARGLLAQSRWRRVLFLAKCAILPAAVVFFMVRALVDPASYRSNSSPGPSRPGLWEKCPYCGSRRVYKYLCYSS